MPGEKSGLTIPTGVALDSAGNLYVADRDNQRIRKVAADTGVITTVAGDGTAAYGGDGGAAGAAQLNSPSGVALDSAGNLYVADAGNHRIRMIETAGFAAGILSTGAISTLAGTGTAGYGGDGGQATAAQLDLPSGVAVDGSGNVYIADFTNDRIRKVDAATGVIYTVAGDGSKGHGGDGGRATAAQLADPWGVALDAAGNVYIADGGNDRIRRVAPVTLTAAPLAIAGGGSATLTVITAANARSAVIEPGNLDVALDASGVGTVEVSPTETTTYTVTVTFADNSTAVASATVTVSDPPTATLSADPATITAGQSAVLSVASTNAVSAEIDQGVGAVTLDNTGAGAVSVSPAATTAYTLTVTDANGAQAIATATVTVSDGSTPTPADPVIITTVAGSGTKGDGGDGGAATVAQLREPWGATVDAAGNLYIADTFNNRIRKVDSGGAITTVAGSGTSGTAGTVGRRPLRSYANPGAWRWTLRATCTSPIRATTASARWIAGAPSPRWREAGRGGTAGTAGRRAPRS